jgi:hypothetical protein
VAGSDYDLVYARNLAPLVKDFPKLLKKAYEYASCPAISPFPFTAPDSSVAGTSNQAAG